jgi:hypothetical protein
MLVRVACDCRRVEKTMRSREQSGSDWVGNRTTRADERAMFPAFGGTKLMIKPGFIQADTCEALSRREFVRGGTVGALGRMLGESLPPYIILGSPPS